MNRYRATGLGLTLTLAAACSSGSDGHAPALAEGGASAQSGAGGHSSSGKSGNSGAMDGGSAGESDEAGAGGAAGEGGAAADGGAAGEGGAFEPGMVIPVTPGACSETTVWASSTPLEGISTDADERLLAITPDELDILFSRDQSLMLAHRKLASSAFDAPVALTVADGYDFTAGAALSADGKTLVLLATDEQSFAAFTRTSRTVPFDTTPDMTAFTGINQRALQTMQHYAAPVLAPDGNTFVFAAFTPEPQAGFPSGYEGVSVVYESSWSGSAWTMPESISQNLFDGTTTARALPSALASDSRTLFYFDEGSGKQMARFRDRPDAPLYTVVDLDLRVGAVPDARCDRLYYSSAGNVLIGAE